jgi:hypothetical protein
LVRITKARSHKRKWRDDPWVAIKARRLRAALAYTGLTVSELAARVGDRQQTIDVLARGKVKRCRRGRRERLERELRLPSGWLGGEESKLPGSWARSKPDLRAWSDLVRLAEARFIDQCFGAWQREAVARAPALKDEPLSDAPGSPWRRHLQRDAHVGFALFDLTNPYNWRRRFLVAPNGGLPPDLTPREREEATRHLVAAFEVLLQPWFTEAAALNRDALRDWWKQVTQARSRGSPASSQPTAVVGPYTQHRRKP